MSSKNRYMISEYNKEDFINGKSNVSFEEMKLRVIEFGGTREQTYPGMWEVTSGDRMLSIIATPGIGARRTV